jgi:hypothetical protein
MGISEIMEIQKGKHYLFSIEKDGNIIYLSNANLVRVFFKNHGGEIYPLVFHKDYSEKYKFISSVFLDILKAEEFYYLILCGKKIKFK